MTGRVCSAHLGGLQRGCHALESDKIDTLGSAPQRIDFVDFDTQSTKMERDWLIFVIGLSLSV